MRGSRRESRGCTDAMAYVADKTNPRLLPYDCYKEFVLRGAIEHKLPAAYVRQLQMIPSQTDSNAERRARNEGVLVEKRRIH